jgi:hypothetical protein
MGNETVTADFESLVVFLGDSEIICFSLSTSRLNRVGMLIALLFALISLLFRFFAGVHKLSFCPKIKVKQRRAKRDSSVFFIVNFFLRTTKLVNIN